MKDKPDEQKPQLEEEAVQKSITTSREHLEQTTNRLWINNLTDTLQLVEDWSVESIHLTALMEKTWNHLAADLPPFFIIKSGDEFSKEEAAAMNEAVGTLLVDLQVIYNILGVRGRRIFKYWNKGWKQLGRQDDRAGHHHHLSTEPRL
jgi:hypothetical protein